MKKPDENSDGDFSEFMWMAEEGVEEDLQQEVEEEMELIEQDYIEAMFDELLREEEEDAVYYGAPPPNNLPNQAAYQATDNCNGSGMQLPKIKSELNPNAPEFVPRFSVAATASS